jgi:hypothetical protein
MSMLYQDARFDLFDRGAPTFVTPWRLVLCCYAIQAQCRRPEGCPVNRAIGAASPQSIISRYRAKQRCSSAAHYGGW